MEITAMRWQVNAEEEKIVREVLGQFLLGKNVWAYGSRVKGKAGRYSDLDLVVFDASYMQVSDALEAFQESALPYVVSLFRWEDLPADFQEVIRQQYVVVQ